MNQIPQRQRGRHVLVTGAGTGIGRAIALRLAAEGAALSLLGRRVALLQETAAAIGDAGGRASVHGCDQRERDQVATAFAAAAAAHGPLHGLVANAGIGGANEPGPADRFDDIVATNLTGTYSCLRAAQRNLAPGPQRRDFVVTSSILGRIGVPGYTAYCATKTGLIGLVRALAQELAADGVQVNAICPGWVNTQMSRDGMQAMADESGGTYQEAHDGAMGFVPVGRMSEPEDIAGMVAWLMSVDARGVVGQALDMNGGAWMG